MIAKKKKLYPKDGDGYADELPKRSSRIKKRPRFARSIRLITQLIVNGSCADYSY